MSSTNDGKSGFIATIVDKVLSYVDRPWRALFILALVLVLGIGYSVYDHRADLIRVFTTPSPPGRVVLRNDGELALVITGLFNAAVSTSLGAISIWAVDVGANRAELRVGKRRDGTRWEIRPAVIQWVHPQVNAAMLTKLTHGDPACDTPAALGPGALSAFLVADDMHYVCYIPEPPNNTEPTAGLVVIAWRAQPEDWIARSGLAAVLAQTDRIVMR